MDIIRSGTVLETKGFQARGLSEIRADVGHDDLLQGGEDMLRVMHEMILGGERFLDGETMGWGSWIMKFRANGDVLELWERDWQTEDFKSGVRFTLHYFVEQHRICEVAMSPFVPPTADLAAAVAPGVLQGRPTRGARQEPHEGWSGWGLLDDRPARSLEDLQRLHLYHVIAERPELTAFLALAPGFSFQLNSDGTSEVGPEPETDAG